jgi:hypothetical protein
MRNPAKKIPLEKKLTRIGQYGEDTEYPLDDFENARILHKKYAKPIGHFVISFSMLEDSVNNDLATAISERAHEPGYRIIKYLRFRDKIDLLRDDYTAMIKYTCPDTRKEQLLKQLHVIYAKLAELSEFRNRVAHANWSSLDKHGFVRCKLLENKTDDGMVFERVKMTPGVLVKFTRQNEALSHRLGDFRENLWAVSQRYISQLERKHRQKTAAR